MYRKFVLKNSFGFKFELDIAVEMQKCKNKRKAAKVNVYD